MNIVDHFSENPDERYAAYHRMAIAIVEVTREKGRCSPQDLLDKGFTREETTDRWHMALAMAEIELKLINS